MNRFITFLSFFILMISIHKVFSQNINNEFKIFENEMFVFIYPNDWKIGELREIENRATNDIIVYLIKDRKIQSQDKLKANFIVYESDFKHNNMDEYINAIKNSTYYFVGAKQKHELDVKVGYTKIDHNHYSSTLKLNDFKKRETTRFITTDSFLHYYLFNDKIYVLDLMYSPKVTGSIINDALLIFDSFKFKN